MALVIEDGSEVTGANSFVDVAELDAFALLRNITTLPTDNAEKEALLILGMDFIKAEESKFQGARNTSTQALSFPRNGVSMFGFPFASDAVPQIVKDAQMQLAIEAVENDLIPTGAGREVIKEKVGEIEVEYSSVKGGTVQPVFNKVVSLLEPIYKSASGSAFTLRV